MRFIIMHKTNAHWEAGAIPSRELIGRVGALLGELTKANALHGAEGLRASSEGVRLKFAEGSRTIAKGPFPGKNELPAGFSILRAGSVEQAIDWASREAEVLGDVEIDIRPVTEPWDIGMMPKPESMSTRRYMVLRKATAVSEGDTPPAPAQQMEMSRLIDEAAHAGMHVTTVNMRPSARGRRYKNAQSGISVTDGPFAESKELIAGYIIISAESLDDAGRWATRYMNVVEADEVDLRELAT